MEFEQSVFEALEWKMGYPHQCEADYDLLVKALQDICRCVAIIANKHAARLYGWAYPEKARRFRDHQKPTGWREAIQATRTVNALCDKYNLPHAFQGEYDWRNHNDELIEMIRAVIAFE